MKTIEEIIKQPPVYLHEWKSKFNVIANFEDIYITEKEFNNPELDSQYFKEKRNEMKTALEKWESVNILFASYNNESYSGDAFVLIEKNGKLYEVNGSHCSCYGLEGQWEPEETNLEALKHRLIEGKMGVDSYSENNYSNELKEFLGI